MVVYFLVYFVYGIVLGMVFLEIEVSIKANYGIRSDMPTVLTTICYYITSKLIDDYVIYFGFGIFHC